ncbi:MAG: 5-oxoprolinase subunit PxpA [Desulfarculaceae bacterium]|nr:5-oxoprolinase subunit PxpA [Desulfarculaceae bacterium]MCF8046266.1 5-oxoprolinase subunit PxpA [Desulfarculaceae bacterium]MCF8065672.1 5-oxoprolinase subunit PxpA [Desulfarculaceae bacterium]MCF8097083.1 5-oxoprolinase subunit PxpA [Desulfarculaceae bacterium]MCF8120951.1 5-oxoprolinase subunit PxpA [Desulfarculaceae bacterium]
MFMDLNCDMGESFGDYCLGCDSEVIRHITSANLACGFHASDPLVMDQTVRLCARHGVAVGAHPGYPDLRGFGRRNLDSTPEEVRTDVLYQTGALAGIAKAHGVGLQHVKPHGALYNTAAAHPATAQAIAQAVASYDPSLILVTLAGPAGETFRTVAQEMGLTVASEAFADRAYTSEGRLVPRGTQGAVIHDPEVVAARCVRMATEGVVESIDGKLVELKADTICVHGDNPSAVELVKALRQALTQAGVELRAMGGAN